MKKNRIVLLLATIIMFTAMSTAEAKQGFYAGLGAAYNTINGDFDGNAGLQGSSDIIILPDISNAFGFDLFAGYGVGDRWAIELDLMNSEHDGTWGGMNGTINYTSFSVNWKYSFDVTGTAQPYVLFGLSSNVLIIKQGAEDTATGQVGDATLSGTGLNIGAGVDTYLSPRVSLSVGTVYRYVEYTHAEGVNNSGTIDNGIDGSGLSFLLTTAFHF